MEEVKSLHALLINGTSSDKSSAGESVPRHPHGNGSKRRTAGSPCSAATTTAHTALEQCHLQGFSSTCYMPRTRQTFLLPETFEELQVKSFIKLKGYNGVALFYEQQALQTVTATSGTRV